MSLASTLVYNGSEALQGCLVESETADNDQEEDGEDLNDRDTQSKRHETAVSVLPGTFPIRTSKGESGEQPSTPVQYTATELKDLT
jgi:hypothetical protein